MATVTQDTLHTISLSGTFLLARSIVQFIPEDESNIVDGRLGIRIAYTLPTDEYGEDPESISDQDLRLMPLTVSMTEKLPWIKYHDVWNFIGPSLESHGYTYISNEGSIPLTPLTYDEIGHEDDRKLDQYGLIISRMIKNMEAKGLFLAHPLIKEHPVYIGLRNNTHYQTRSQVQIPDDYFQFLGHQEIPLYGDLIVRTYKNWIFPPESQNPTISDLELRIGQALIDEDLDTLLPGLLPLRIILTEFFKGELVGKKCEDTFLINSRRQRLSHSYYERRVDSSEHSGRDRTFSKLGDYDVPISVMLSSRGTLPFQLESNLDIQDLKNRRFFGGTQTICHSYNT